MFQLTRFSHNTVFFRNQNARYAGTRCTAISEVKAKAQIREQILVADLYCIYCGIGSLKKKTKT